MLIPPFILWFVDASPKVDFPTEGKEKSFVSQPQAVETKDLKSLAVNGTDLMEAMYMIANVLGNKYVEKRFRLAVGEVERGMNLTMALDSYNIFQQMLIQMISVGERTGELDSVLMSSCTFFDQEVENSLKSMTALIQPILLVIMGGAIAIMFLAVYSPILSIMNTLV